MQDMKVGYAMVCIYKNSKKKFFRYWENYEFKVGEMSRGLAMSIG